jgi:hypothetical protein
LVLVLARQRRVVFLVHFQGSFSAHSGNVQCAFMEP